MQKAADLGYNEIVITGSPEYYKKYGFESASKYNIFYEGTNTEDESPFFMIRILNKEKFNITKGVYTDPSCYNIDELELAEFDKKFPPKIKEKRLGQLE